MTLEAHNVIAEDYRTGERIRWDGHYWVIYN